MLSANSTQKVLTVLVWRARLQVVTRQINVTHAMESAFISSLTACAEIPYCVISITASIDFMHVNFCRVRALAEALPAQYVKERFAVQGGICIW